MKIKFEQMLAVLKGASRMSIREEITRDALRELQASQQEISALQEQVQKLAAENSTVRVMNDALSEELRGYESDGAYEGPNMHKLWHSNADMPGTDAVIREIGAKVAADAEDTRRMDWLVSMCVEVRKPLRYGSAEVFRAVAITDEEDDYHATTLREQIDSQLRAAPDAEEGV